MPQKTRWLLDNFRFCNVARADDITTKEVMKVMLTEPEAPVQELLLNICILRQIVKKCPLATRKFVLQFQCECSIHDCHSVKRLPG